MKTALVIDAAPIGIATTLKRRDVEHLLFRRESASYVTDFFLFLLTL